MATVAALAGAASSPAGIVILSVGSAVLVAKWLVDVYENTCVYCVGPNSNLQPNTYTMIALTTLPVLWHIL